MLEGATQVSAPAEMKQQTETATEPAKKQLSESYQSIHEKVKAFLKKLLNIFWELPTGVVAGGSALALIAFILLVEGNEDSIRQTAQPS